MDIKIHFFKVTGDARHYSLCLCASVFINKHARKMKIAVGSNDCLSGLKGQNNSLQSPSRASSNGGGAGARRKEVQSDGKL